VEDEGSGRGHRGAHRGQHPGGLLPRATAA
jgi:hypothetical protein